MSPSLVIRGATTIPANGSDPIPDSIVVIDGDRIAWVGSPRDETRLEAANGAPEIDAAGQYLIPGLVNLHDHLDMHRIPGTMHDRVAGPTELTILNSVRNALISLAMGVTTIRDLGSKDATNIVMRDAVAAGRLMGPRIQACGQMISITGGHGQPLCAEGDGVDGIRRVTREQIKRGADVIKVCASGGVVAMKHESPWAQQLSDEELGAAVSEAHRAGLRVASHAQPPKAIQASVRAGVDTIEHGAFMDRETAALLAEHEVVFVPTVDDSVSVADHGLDLSRPAWMVEAARASIDSRMQAITYAIEAGVVLGVGSDVAGECGREMAHLVACGLTPMQALEAGTRVGAKTIGLEDDLGTVEAGKLADLVLLSRDPLADLSACDEAVEVVVKNGVPVRARELLAAIPGGALLAPRVG
jgi:imidazolonepropionase-like amidohydrolase